MEGWPLRSKWGLGLALCSLAGSGILGWLQGWRFAVKKYSLEQGERDEVCVRSSGLNAVSGFGSEETDRLECGGKECLSKGDCCKLGYTIAVEVWAG
jgi:hypothetical protein